MRHKIAAIIGPGEGATDHNITQAFNVGSICAQKGYTVLTGGRKSGVMHSALEGAKAHNGTTIGILPGSDANDASEFVDIPICTNMGQSRNLVNILSADVIISVGMGPGTASEISLAVKHEKHVYMLADHPSHATFFDSLSEKKFIHLSSLEQLSEVL